MLPVLGRKPVAGTEHGLPQLKSTEIGGARHGAAAGRPGILPARADPRAILAADLAAIRVTRAEHHVAAAVGVVRPEQCAELILLPVPFLRDAVGRVELRALEVFLRDDVDHARDGVGTVHGGRTAGDHFHVAYGGGRNRVEIHGEAAVDRLHAPAIDEHEIAIGAQVPQVDGCRAWRRGG